MLQQTRAAVVIPYYRRFLRRFPDVESLAQSNETELLLLWSGLGYYARARNLRRAAMEIAAMGVFPDTFERLKRLPGVGAYTAAAIASIAFNQPHAVLDANAIRVFSRLIGEKGDIRSAVTRARLGVAADDLLDRSQPGLFNQAVMELGATICLPRKPRCELCVLVCFCYAAQRNLQVRLPRKAQRKTMAAEAKSLYLCVHKGKVLLRCRNGERQLNGFWELPEAGQLPGAEKIAEICSFHHSITNHRYEITVIRVRSGGRKENFHWVPIRSLEAIPLTTVARKALKAAWGSARNGSNK